MINGRRVPGMIWWDGFNDDRAQNHAVWGQNVPMLLHLGILVFRRWREAMPDINLFNSNGTIDFTDSNQGQLGTCAIKAAMGSIAEFPDMVRSTFLNEETNDEGIYNIRFFIRGKPWVVSIDDYLVYANLDPYTLVYAL